ncbi:hypothetical protein ACS0PU_002773 [Formica fusca]
MTLADRRQMHVADHEYTRCKTKVLWDPSGVTGNCIISSYFAFIIVCFTVDTDNAVTIITMTMHATRRCLEKTPGLPFRRTLQTPPFQI